MKTTEQIIPKEHGAILQTDLIKNWPKIVKTMTLQELIELKMKTIEKIKSLLASLVGLRNINKESVKKVVEQIEVLQYNLTIFKQLNAIANVGSPEANMFGINASIFQSADLNALNGALAKVLTKTIVTEEKDTKEMSELRAYLNDKIIKNKSFIGIHHRTQKEYNNRVKVQVEYLAINV